MTQHHSWGQPMIRQHQQCLIDWEFSDEYFWEHTSAEDFVRHVIGEDCINQFIANGGGINLTDTPNPLPRFHKIVITAHHDDSKWLTWIQLKRNQ